ncbi:enoyl-CoA hydratase [Rhizobium sp. KVB221]|uniref:Enoyl-CoA hydratase domain-containing protein 3, mitochondrial n=1 Tax=Rhizobium setariae TaxID=2801340 RepID=A0A936YLC4_9HYPH|nr:enoyl-CoA hydratase [Rhizobium setariae]MBL0370847.1 enoyl-CoA hydratase [Rhizobium setariae]
MRNELVLIDVADHIATITLNRPDKGNALSAAMMDALEDRVAEVSANPDVRVVILAANGKIFSAGHDLEEMLEHEDRGWQQAHFDRCSRLMMAIRACPKPFVARVQGAAVAAGCQLVATCDLAYAVETAKFGINGINLGLFCSTPSVALSRAVQPKQALDLALTGRLILAPRAAEIGLINEAVPAERLDEVVQAAASAIAAKLPEAIGLGKSLFYRQTELEIADAYADAAVAMADNMDLSATREKIGGFVRKG